MHSIGPEGISLPTNKEARYDLNIKRRAIGRFMFNMAFENSIEPGYVTEKPYDALLSGIICVYMQMTYDTKQKNRICTESNRSLVCYLFYPVLLAKYSFCLPLQTYFIVAQYYFFAQQTIRIVECFLYLVACTVVT
jgi:hypothetical protein